MAEAVTGAGSAPGKESWPVFFRRQIAAGAHFWLDFLALHGTEYQRPYEERHNLAKALGLALDLDDTWDLGVDLALAFHPFVSWARTWASWEHFLETSLSLCRKRRDQTRESAVLNQLGELHQSRGEWTAANECHEAAYQLSYLVGDERGCARAQANIGDILRAQARFKEAELALGKALSGYQACEDAQGQAVVYNSLGVLFYEQRQWDQARACYERAHELWAETGNPSGLALVWQNLGNIHFVQENWSEAERCYGSAIVLYEQTHSHIRLAAVWVNLGNVRLRQGRPDEAETLYRQAKEVVQAAGDNWSLAQVYNNLGLAYTRQKKWGLAEEYFKRSIDLWHSLQQAIGQANAEDNLAEVYLQQSKWKQARAVLAQAQRHLEPLDRTGRAVVLWEDIRRHWLMAQTAD